MRCTTSRIIRLIPFLHLGIASGFVPIPPSPTHVCRRRIQFRPPDNALWIPSDGTSTPTSPSAILTRLQESKVSNTETLAVAQGQNVDWDALLKYHAAIAIQLTCIYGLFKGLDVLIDLTHIVDKDSIPTLALAPIFYLLSLKSRVFNPLNNQRPSLKQAMNESKETSTSTATTIPNDNGQVKNASPGFRDRIMPSWTPPGPVFPIMWILIIGPLRAYSSALVWQANGHVFAHPAIMAFMFHLAVGDVWNTINNTEQRYGASVTGVLCVTASALMASIQYYDCTVAADNHGIAGQLLGLSMIWFAVASSLVTATWRLNPITIPTTTTTTTTSSNDGNHDKQKATIDELLLDPLYPIVREGRPTTFAWFRNAGQ